MTARTVQEQLETLGDPERAAHSQRFFKTGPGEYGEGDVFRGIRVPVLRQLAKQYAELPLAETVKLLESPYHEDRLLALIILTHAFSKSDLTRKKTIYNLYLRHTKWINNWDLVDASAHKIVGPFLMERDRAPLYRLARSASLWERRIAIISTFAFIGREQFDDALAIAEILLEDEEDLIHKAVGWVLREIGKRDLEAEEDFLLQHYRSMPRTMLRYAIERFPEQRRREYLEGSI